MKKLNAAIALLFAGILAACGNENPGNTPATGGGSVVQPPAGNESPATATQAVWLTDFDAAMRKARETSRPVLINITGSDWCPPCIALKRTVFDTERFQQYARENLVLLEIDFPRRKQLSPEQQRHNQAVADRYGATAFPTIVLADAEARQLKQMVGLRWRDADEFIRWIEN